MGPRRRRGALGAPAGLYPLAHGAHARLTRLRRAVRERLGLGPPLQLLPYRGYGTLQRAVIKARVLEAKGGKPPRTPHTLVGAAVASWRRYNTDEVPGVRVEARWGEVAFEGFSDEEGFVDLWVEPPPQACPGWNDVRLAVVAPGGSRGAEVTAPVLLAGPDAQYGVISDVDDTVIVTGVTNLLKRAWALFLTDHRVRLPFEGVSAFYAALHEGTARAGANPIFYVSSSPWNLYEHLDAFFEQHRIPAGPLLLRDWGLTRQGFAPGGGHGHKRDKIRELLEVHAPLPFLLMGDSGQEDAEHYLAAVREHPGRIRGIYIRNVSSHPERLQRLSRIADEVRAAGSQLVVVDDTVAAARHAAAQGWIRSREVADVQERKREDEAAATVLDRLDQPR